MTLIKDGKTDFFQGVGRGFIEGETPLQRERVGIHMQGTGWGGSGQKTTKRKHRR